MSKFFLVISIILLYASPTFSQEKTDSLLKILESKTNGDIVDSSAYGPLTTLIEHYYSDNPLKSLELANKYLNSARSYNNKRSIAHAYHFLGDYYKNENLPVIAIDYYFSSLYIYEEANDIGAITYTNIDIGNIYYELGKFDVALQYYEKAAKIAGEDDVVKAKAVAINNIALVYRSMGEYPKALQKHLEALELRKLANDKNLLAHSYNYLGTIYSYLEDYPNAEKYYLDAAKFYKELKDAANEGRVMMNLGKLHLDRNDKEKSIELRNGAIDLFMSNKKFSAAADAMNDLAEFYKDDKNHDLALKNSKHAYNISDQYHYTLIKQRSLKLISDIYSSKGDMRSAYEYLKEYDAFRDSLNHEEAQRKVVNLQFSNEIQRRDRELGLMKKQNELNAMTIENQKKGNTYLLVILGIIFVLLLVIFYAFRRERGNLRKLEDRNKLIDEKNRKIEVSIKMLEEAKEDAERNARVKTDFLSIMSHELRTPMNAVLGMTQVIMSENPRPDQKENLETLKLSAENLLSIIDDILDYNRLESGQIIIVHNDFSLKILMENLLKVFDFSIKQKGLSVKYNYDKNLREYFKGDEVRLNQIMTNLIANAIKFTDKGTIEINIEEKVKKEDSTKIRFTIKDTGIGISSEDLEEIFNMFTQARTDSKRKYGGTGLGLSIVEELLQLMNSDIHVISTPGKGSEFYFEVELTNSEEKIPEISEKIDTPKQDIKFRKILIVEDNNVNQLVMKKILKNTGLEIEIADNGRIGLEKVMENDYDFIFMDLLMPEMDGYEATREIRKAGKDVPIIALTADVMKGVQEKTKQAGMNGYITKPVKKDELLKTLADYSGV